MRLPAVRGMIDRRVLVNYRIDPECLATILPPPFEPQLVDGYGIAGICLIRLKQIRPLGCPAFLGFASENAAHRIAVSWPGANGPRTGVFVPRRDTSSRLNVWLGNRIFPSSQHLANFDVQETDTEYSITLRSVDGRARLHVDASIATDLPDDSVFPSMAAASEFFRCGCVGYSPCRDSAAFDGIELRTDHWHMEPLAVRQVQSSFFADRQTFPAGSVALDNALLMRAIDHQWHSCPQPLTC